MKMMKENKRRGFVALLATLAVVFSLMSGCDPQGGGLIPSQGGEISFSASTSYISDSDETKTIYSGDRGGTPTFGQSQIYRERIDWVAGRDEIRILCNEARPPQNATVAGHTDGNGNLWSDYLVTKATQAKATISPMRSAAGSANGLQWGTGAHYFYALYPSPRKTAPTDSVQVLSMTVNRSTHVATVTGFIPPTQKPSIDSSYTKSGVKVREFFPNMNFAAMAAFYKASSPGSNVELKFRPLVTTLRFELKAADDMMASTVLEHVELQSGSSFLAGHYKAEIGGTANNAAAQTPKNGAVNGGIANLIRIPLPAGFKLSKDIVTAVTFLCLPVEQTDLTLGLHFAGGETRHLKLSYKDGASYKNVSIRPFEKSYFDQLQVHPSYTLTGPTSPITVQNIMRGQKVAINHKINNPTDPTPDTIAFSSFKEFNGTRTEVPVTFEFAAAENGPWYKSGASGMPAALTKMLSTVNVQHVSDGDYKAWITLKANEEFKSGGKKRTERSTTLRAKSNKGTKAAPQDLSLMEPLTGSLRTVPVTANCYLIQTPGWYMFPLVYGNAIDGTHAPTAPHWNASAYETGLSNYFFSNFATGTAGKAGKIAQPFLHADADINLSAAAFKSQYETVIVWQDVASGESFLTGHEIIVPSSESVTSGASTLRDVPYVRFQVAKSLIQEGNVLVAVRHKTTKTIVWSWHIWVSAEPSLSTIPVTNDDNNVTDLLPVNLGWNLEMEGILKERKMWVRITQNEGYHAPLIFRIEHPEQEVFVGNSTYYQWGRKDPFLPSTGISESTGIQPMRSEDVIFNKGHHSPGGYTVSSGDDKLNEQTFTQDMYDNQRHAHTVRMPYAFYRGVVNTSTMWGRSSTFLWNVTHMANSPLSSDKMPVKSVYDPCPPGFSVPRLKFASGFSATKWGNILKEDTSDTDGYNDFYTNSSKTATIRFPTQGERGAGSGRVRLGYHCRYWTGGFLVGGAPDYGDYIAYFNGNTMNGAICTAIGQAPVWSLGEFIPMPVRPAKEEAWVATTSGTETYGYNSGASSGFSMIP